MSNTLFNPTQFPVFVEELQKQLAPFEAIAVKDAEIVARYVATGVLKDNTDEWEQGIHERAEQLAQDTERDIEDAEKEVRADLAKEIAKWHDEHDAPAGQVAEPGETVEANPVVDHSEPAKEVHSITPAEKVQTGGDPEIPKGAEAQDGDPANFTGADETARRTQTPQGVEVNQGPEVEVRTKA